jgi:hypothetical protein
MTNARSKRKDPPMAVITEPITVWSLQNITDHPAVSPLAEQRRVLRERRVAVSRDLQAASTSLIQLRETGATPAAVRIATRRLEVLEEEI